MTMFVMQVSSIAPAYSPLENPSKNYYYPEKSSQLVSTSRPFEGGYQLQALHREIPVERPASSWATFPTRSNLYTDHCQLWAEKGNESM
jgi:hypothetical protein